MDAKSRALRYLNDRMCSAHQMKDYLRRKGYEDEEIDPVIEELKEYHYIDDLKYASAFMEAGFEKGRGIGRIKRELRAKGVDPETIAFAEEALENIPDEKEVAMKLGRSLVENIDIESLDRKEKEALKGKIARRLASRGFSTDTIYSVIGRLF